MFPKTSQMFVDFKIDFPIELKDEFNIYLMVYNDYYHSYA